jgi:hypothetical protein
MTTATTPSWLPSIGSTVYIVERLPDDQGRLAWAVQREDGKAAYQVRTCPAGNWSCTCKSFWFNKEREQTACKHITMIAGMLLALGVTITPEGGPLPSEAPPQRQDVV